MSTLLITNTFVKQNRIIIENKYFYLLRDDIINIFVEKKISRFCMCCHDNGKSPIDANYAPNDNCQSTGTQKSDSTVKYANVCKRRVLNVVFTSDAIWHHRRSLG